MKVIDQFPFEFESQTFEIYWTDDKNLILPIRPICDELGLDFSGQLQHIKRDEVLAEHLFIVVASTLRTDGKAQDREVACISLKRMHLWFGTINTSRVRPELREKIVHFKRELGDVAWAAFRTRVLPEDILAELDASLPSPEREYHKAMDRAAALRDHVQKHGKEIDNLRSRIEQLEARLNWHRFHQQPASQTILECSGGTG
ncbi:MAG: phage antirepressor N-terminal domain-containing protein [Nitrospira sp.]